MVWIYCVQEIVSKCLQEFLLLILTISWNMQYYHHSNFTDKEAETAKFCNLSAIMHVGSGGIMFWTWTVLFQGTVTLRILPGVTAWACSRPGQGKKHFEIVLHILKKVLCWFVLCWVPVLLFQSNGTDVW